MEVSHRWNGFNDGGLRRFQDLGGGTWYKKKHAREGRYKILCEQLKTFMPNVKLIDFERLFEGKPQKKFFS